VHRTKEIVDTVLAVYPDTQAIYLFGSYGTADEWPDSDVDIALLLPPVAAKEAGSLLLGELHLALQSLLNKEVDLLNLRQVSTVMQKEVVFGGRRIFCADEYATAEFEMLVLSFYQKLNEERREILKAFRESKRAYAV
jgi:uncharacterized protein